MTADTGKILIVDDDEAIREALERAIALEGFAVSHAADGRAALDAIAQAPPSVIVLV